MLHVVQGSEYTGETYIHCDAHPELPHPSGNTDLQGGRAVFEGESAGELRAFLAEHATHP